MTIERWHQLFSQKIAINMPRPGDAREQMHEGGDANALRQDDSFERACRTALCAACMLYGGCPEAAMSAWRKNLYGSAIIDMINIDGWLRIALRRSMSR